MLLLLFPCFERKHKLSFVRVNLNGFQCRIELTSIQSIWLNASFERSSSSWLNRISIIEMRSNQSNVRRFIQFHLKKKKTFPGTSKLRSHKKTFTQVVFVAEMKSIGWSTCNVTCLSTVWRLAKQSVAQWIYFFLSTRSVARKTMYFLLVNAWIFVLVITTMWWWCDKANNSIAGISARSHRAVAHA